MMLYVLFTQTHITLYISSSLCLYGKYLVCIISNIWINEYVMFHSYIGNVDKGGINGYTFTIKRRSCNIHEKKKI